MAVAAGLLAVAGFAAAIGWVGGPFDPAGAVAGAIGTPGTTESAPPPGGATAAEASTLPAIAGSAAPRPTPTPRPLPTPVPTPAAPESLTGYRSPLPRGRLTLPFGPTPWGSRLVDGEPFHDGVDLATFCGDRVVAAHAGTVLAAGRRYDAFMGWVGDLKPYLDRLERKRLYGTLPIVVVVDDGNGYRSIYAHFSKVVVKAGETVRAGQFLGYEGMTGRASGCHLHYGLFSPLETATFDLDPATVKRMKLPAAEIARIDPLRVVPGLPRPAKTPRPGPVSTPTPTPTP